ncbi:MAG: M14 family metallopeptidase, partial [Kangiellaceae bacterium]|nr:M14 family metallopeptidase [Kangiellaceae bacterium]
MTINKVSAVLLSLVLLWSSLATAGIKLKPTPFPEGQYNKPLLTATYDPAIAKPETFLGFAAGQRVASPAQISEAVLAWDQQSVRVKALEYARSHEGRPLYSVLISSEKNLANVDTIKADIARLANPKGLSESEQVKIIDRLPAIAWMAYSIHGNESSGADAALTAIYHLAAATDQEVVNLLDNMIVIIDPMMNPDGRARFAKELQESRGIAQNVDDQSLLHTGSWPYGRTNHYYFDLNRDFIFTTQPETRGRVAQINQWFPQLMIDGHEMGAQDTYLFAPAREPVNPHLPDSRKKWGHIFADDQAAAFDKNGWRYYTGEWFENLYAGYSNYAEYRSAVHILYEQSRMAEDGVRRPEGTVQTYQESVHHQLVSTLANLKTLSKHSKAMYQDFVEERRGNISSSGPYANRSFAIVPTANKTRMSDLVDALTMQGIELYQLRSKTTLSVDDQFGGKNKKVTMPKGTLIIPNRQPEARLIATMLEFDAAIKPEVLLEERQRNLRDGSSLMYDITAWNLTMMYGLESYTVKQSLSSMVEPFEPSAAPPVNTMSIDDIAWAVDGADDASVSFAARLMEQGVQVRAIDKATVLGSVKLSRGSVLVTKTDNPNFQSIQQQVADTAKELAIELKIISQGLGKGDLPDWGGSHFRLLTRPQVAILARGRTAPGDVGSLWFSLDSNLAIRHSMLDSMSLGYSDLRRYNVIIMPSQYVNQISSASFEALQQWVEQGGTLIAIDRSARALIKQGMSQVSLVEDSFADAEKFDLSLQREWLA